MVSRKRQPRRSPIEDASPPLVPDPPNPTRRRRQVAYEAIAEAKRLLDPGYWKYRSAGSEQQQRETDLAREFLKDIEKEARKKGGKRGNSPGAAQNERLAKALGLLANGGSLKQFAEDETRGKKTITSEDRLLSLRAQLPKWCKRVYDAMLECYGHHCRSHIASATDSMIRHALKSWPGVQFPHDTEAFRYAIRHHLRKKR